MFVLVPRSDISMRVVVDQGLLALRGGRSGASSLFRYVIPRTVLRPFKACD